MEVKVTSPDYKHFDKETILHDFLERINHYEKLYETLDENLEPDLAYLKIFDTGRKVTVHKHEGHIQARIVYYLMNVRITPRTIYLTRHGESYNNVIGNLLIIYLYLVLLQVPKCFVLDFLSQPI